MVKWIVFIVLVLSGAALSFFYLQIKDLEKNPAKLPTAVAADAVTLAHAYRDGAHRYAGIISLPNSCHTVNARVVRDSKFPENFELRVETKDMQLETAFCSQLRSRYQFSVLEEGPEKINLRLLINGKEREYKLSEGQWQNDGATLQVNK